MGAHGRHWPLVDTPDMEKMKGGEKKKARRRAIALSRAFHGFDPRRIRRVPIAWPKALVSLGPCVRLEYYSEKFDEKGRIYFHDFELPCEVFAADAPQPDGSNLLIIQGKFQIKPEGITK